jgi:5-formyltetrahydrofolate cyclo-ligase
MDVTKNELRRQMRLRLQASTGDAPEKSQAIVTSITAHPAWTQVRVLSLYSALPGEPDLASLLLSETGERPESATPRRFCYPRIEAGGMAFFEVESSGDLMPASWHPKIREPVFDPARLMPPEKIDLILVPGLAFTHDGQRLGRGGGYYDRYLAALPAGAVKLGVCFQCQLVDSLPLEAHDQRVHTVVTENGFSGHLPTIARSE